MKRRRPASLRLPPLEGDQYLTTSENIFDANPFLDFLHIDPWCCGSLFHWINFCNYSIFLDEPPVNIKKRHRDIIGLLLRWAPLTAEGIWRASRAFPMPFTSIAKCRAELAEMYRSGLINRAPIPDTGTGQKPYAYFLRRGAAVLVPEVQAVPHSNSLFSGLSRDPFHALAVGEFGSLVEAHAAEHDGVRLLEHVRDRQWSAPIDFGPAGVKQLIPDHTMLLDVAGKRRVLFLELVNRTAVINPGCARSVARSFAFQLEKYRRFNTERRNHPLWKEMERYYGHIGGFQVLVVTLRDNVQTLIAAARETRSMFLFAGLDDLGAANLFGDPVWWRPPWRGLGARPARLIES
ncbi:MAG: hypothetical protein OXU20_24530 [Myxococcales bacterium]|nr:hypothetical protein [Myxococcales bacterium]